MNLLNRLILIFLCLVLIAGGIAAIGLAWAIPDDSIDALRRTANWLDDHNTDGTKAIISAVGGCVSLLGLLLLTFELWPRSSPDVKVTDVKAGDAVISTAVIGQRVEEAVSQVPHVADARATIKAKRRGVVVSLDLHVDPEANLATVTDEACEAAQEVLTNRVHVELAEPPRARLHYRELRLRRGQERARVPERRLQSVVTTPARPPVPLSPVSSEPLETVAVEEAPVVVTEEPVSVASEATPATNIETPAEKGTHEE